MGFWQPLTLNLGLIQLTNSLLISVFLFFAVIWAINHLILWMGLMVYVLHRLCFY